MKKKKELIVVVLLYIYIYSKFRKTKSSFVVFILSLVSLTILSYQLSFLFI